MAYCLHAEETVEEAFRRTEGEQLDRAITELTEGVKVDQIEAVHAARKALKKERALLRLLRGSLDPTARRSQNEALREAARRLSATRDADVVIQALETLAAQSPRQLPKQTFDAIRSQLDARREARRAGSDGAIFGEVAEELKATRARAAEAGVRGGGWSAIGPGLRRSYDRGRKALRRARRDPSVENLHEWRKRTKDLWYHLRLLVEISPGTMAGQACEAHTLSDLLGDDHDLAVLNETVEQLAAAVPDDLSAVTALIAYRRKQLQQEAMLVGARLYAEKPNAFMRRLRVYWRASRELARAADARARAADARHPAEVAESPGTTSSDGLT